MSDRSGKVNQGSQDRALRLFSYLRELTQLRSKTIKDIDQYEEVLWLSQIPREKECHCIAWNPATTTDIEHWIEIKKPRRKAPPPIPTELTDWVSENELRDSDQIPRLLSHITIVRKNDEPSPEISDVTQVVHLKDKPELETIWKRYLSDQWEPWAADDRRMATVETIYKKLFAIYQKQQRLGEAYEVILGLGFLSWPKPGFRIRRHLLTTRVSMSFDSQKGVISVGAPADGTKLQLEQEMVDVNDRPVSNVCKKLEEQASEVGEELWDGVHVESVLESWLNETAPTGQFKKGLEIAEDPERPILSSGPALILRKQTERNLLRVYQEIIEQINNGQPIPPGVETLVDIVEDRDASAGPTNSDNSPPDDSHSNGEIYFPLPSNKEQTAIAQRLSSRHGVLVQGPPGTGKSHTIANLVCHLLAQGKRILVTSHTPRALRVLQHKLPKEVSALCVSLLGEDLNGMKGLENSVQGITDRFNTHKAEESQKKIRELESALRDIRSKIATNRQELRAIREQETYVHELPFGAYSGTLAAIARKIASEQNQFSWFADQVAENESCPLSNAEGSELADLLETITPAVEREICSYVPGLKELPDPEQFLQGVKREEVARKTKLANKQHEESAYYSALARCDRSLRSSLSSVVEQIAALYSEVNGFSYAWVQQALDQVLTSRDRVWRELLAVTQARLKLVREIDEQILEANVQGAKEEHLSELKLQAQSLLSHLKAGKGLGFSIFRPRVVKNCKYLLEEVRIDGHRCDSVAALERLVGWLDAMLHIRVLRQSWLGKFDPLGKGLRFEVADFEDLCEPIQAILSLWEKIGEVRRLCSANALPEPKWVESNDVTQYFAAIKAVEAAKALDEISKAFDGLATRITQNPQPNQICKSLVNSIRNRDIAQYRAAYEQVQSVWKIKQGLERRSALLSKLSAHVPALVDALKRIETSPGLTKRLSTIEDAWNWSRARAWLAKRNDSRRQDGLKASVDADMKRLRQVLRDLAAEKAWKHCFQRMTEHERQYLIAWSKAVRKIGKGTGKHANKHRRDARAAMEQCRSAIPAWIMPIYKVAETVRPGVEAFDVAIIDEASQSGPEALFLYYLAKKIVVVGDDKQISPEYWIEKDAVQILREKWIKDIPHSNHIGVDDSFFDLAQIRLSGRIVLREHFRCMPEIIQFSNNLCYESEPLIPLKQFGGSRLVPVIKTVHVKDGFQEGSTGKVWNPPEAEAVVNTIQTLVKDERYKGKSFGVISLLGELHAKHIEKRLLETIGPEEIERRQLVCGDAYAFQGDERDIIFLSMVSAPSEETRVGVLSKARDERRFNVAASRACEQMWLFHSATLDTLSKNCLRHRLLEYCLNPRIQRTEIEGTSVETLRMMAHQSDRSVVRPPSPFDSWFELDVFLRIHDRGFRALPQYEVAGRRIDIVVEGMRGRLAVECDGDHWHGPDRYEEDMARQIDLERCGFRFWRVRESAFYLDPQAAMKGLWQTLASVGIQPANGEIEVETTSTEPVAEPVVVPFPEKPAHQEKSGELEPEQAVNAEVLEANTSKSNIVSAVEVNISPVQRADEPGTPMPKVSGEVCSKLIKWNNKHKRMTNTRELYWLSAVNRVAFQYDRGRPITAQELKAAQPGYERALELGFDPRRTEN